jgi:GWxTD domain-containing protein
LWTWLAVAALAAGPALKAQAEPGGAGPTVRAFRFYRADANQTRVTAFVEVPYALLTPSGEGPDALLRYGVTVRIVDSTGKSLYQTGWPGRARAELRTAQGSGMELLDFSLAPGRYQLDVDLDDSVSGRHLTASTTVDAYSTPPSLSDLMLSPNMRLATGEDTMPRPGERRWGNTLVTAATRLRLTPVRTHAYYLLEAYAHAPESGTMQVQVTDSMGRALVATRPQPVEVAAGGSVLKGQLDLSGLPSGKYRLAVHLAVGGKEEERSESFEMAGFEETMEREAVRLTAERETDRGYFGAMNDTQLDEAFGPLIYVTTPDSLSVWSSGLSVAAKREFLTRFWVVRDPTPNTPRNEARETFYAKVDYANRNFGEGGRAAAPGWRTDRGRIYVKFGPPGETLDRRMAGKSPPYQVWRYTRTRENYYLFIDRTGFGAYKLMFTNDLKETSNPNFRDILDAEALQDVSRFLGIDLILNSAGGQ